MAVTAEYNNLDSYFRNTTGDKIIINDLNYFNMNDIDMVNNTLLTIYDSDAISTVPSCDCGNFKSRYLLGQICSECGTICKDPFQKTDPLLWMKTLNNSIPFINPMFWLMVRVLIHRKHDYLRYLSDPKYNPPVKLPVHIAGLKEELNNVRTYTNTINNIGTILKYLRNHAKYKEQDKQDSINQMLYIWENHREDLFSQYLPIVNKQLFVMTNTNKGKFTNLAIADVIDAVMLWIKTCSIDNITNKKGEVITASVVSKLANLYKEYLKKYVAGKPGGLRKHIYGGRSHFTFRCVITSIPGPHKHNVVKAPWSVGVSAFRPHLLNKLMKRGFTYKKASQLLFKSVKLYNKLIDELLNELVKDSPYPEGIPVLVGRNPSLLQSSIMQLYIGEFKTDTNDLTLSLSQLVVKFPNGDYDGDELNVTILLDNMLADLTKTLAPFYNIPDMSKPNAIAGELTLLSPANSLLGNYILDNDEDPANDTVSDRLEYV